MQIRLTEGAVWRCAGALQQGTAAGAEGEKTHVGVRSERSRRRDDMVYRTARQKKTERADARKDFVLERVESCGSSDESGRGTKSDFGSSQSFDDPHRSTTLGAESRIVGVMGGR
jgi:hypothetical protein